MRLLPTPLTHAGFRQLWSAGVLSTAGSEISRLALLLHLVKLNQTGAGIALWIALRTIPGFIAAPWTGILIDSVNPRFLLVASDVIRALLLLFLVEHPDPSTIFTVAAIQAIADTVFEPARKASVPRLVPPESLEPANALDQTSHTILMIACPAAGAQMYMAWGLGTALTVDAASYVLSAVLIGRIHLLAGAAVNRAASWRFRDVAAGWRALSADSRVQCLVLLQFVSLLCTGLWMPLAPSFIRDVLGASDIQIGWQLSAFGLGGAIGALMAPRLVSFTTNGRLLIFALFLEAVHMTLYAFITQWLLSLACILSWGAVVSVIVVSSVTYLQRTIPESSHGRVFTLVRQSEQIGMALAMAIAAAVTQTFSAQFVFAVAGLTYAGCTLLAMTTRGGREILEKPESPAGSTMQPGRAG